MIPGITIRARELLAYIEEYSEQHNVPPTCREMAWALKLKSPSNIPRLLGQLQERGYITRRANRARAVEIVTFTPGKCPHCGEPIDRDHVRVTDKRATA